MNKVIYFDTETTGVNKEKDEIITLAMILDNPDGSEHSRKLFEIQPTDIDGVSDEAIEVHGITREMMRKFQPANAVFPMIQQFLDAFINRKDPGDKAYLSGYNVGFDADFVGNFFRNHDRYGFGCYTNWRKLDPLHELFTLDYEGLLPILPNLKLETVCKLFHIEIDAHDAMSDTIAARALMKRILIKRKQIRERPA